MSSQPTNLSLAREAAPSLPVRAFRAVKLFVRTIGRLIGTLFVIGLSLLPLTALLVALPAVAPSEAVLSDTVTPARSRARRFARRALALCAGFVVLAALTAFAIEVVARLPLPPGGQMATLAKKLLGFSVSDVVPDDTKPADVEPLKGMLERRDEARKSLIDQSATDADRARHAADLVAVNAEIADWAEDWMVVAESAARGLCGDRTGEPVYRSWMVPAELATARAAVKGAPAEKRAAVEEQVAARVSDVTRRWLPAPELLVRRFVLTKAATRTNLNPRDRREAEEKLAEVNTEIEKRLPGSPKLRLLEDKSLKPILGVPLWQLLPPALVEHWQFVLLIVYGTDLVLLLLIGKVPLAYNLRYLQVRWRDTALTAVAFTVVVALVVALLAFVNGMYKLNESTGVPGNVLVMSEGSTDELFSNLSRGGDIDNALKVSVYADASGKPVGAPGKGASVARVAKTGGALARVPADAPKDLPGAEPFASYESYLVVNQAVPTKPGEQPRRRFVQARAFLEPLIGAAVHNVDLEPGGRWFTDNAVEPGAKAPDGREYLQCCVGEGASGAQAQDLGKPRLEVGDTFELGERWWKVIGLMRTRGTTYGSEVWTGINNPVVRAAGKGDKFTTLVLRMEDESDESARAMAFYLSEVYEAAKLKAFAEPDYYKELTKTNEQFLSTIVFLAVIMAVGGIFGVMNTMFASIAARMKEVGVMRILGFKRWQILISFMFESLLIAFVGGLLGCALGYLANGFEATSQLSSGQGGKSVTLTMVVDLPILATGMLFTLVMGRLGGLVPALSAMRMEILESLR